MSSGAQGARLYYSGGAGAKDAERREFLNPKGPRAASHLQTNNMKQTLVTSFCALALALTALGQIPSIPPDPAAPALATPSAATVPNPAAIAPAPVAPAPVPSATVSAKDADDLQSRIERKVKKGVHITFGEDDEDRAAEREEKGDAPATRVRHRERVQDDSSDVANSALMAIPIVGIIFTTLFGTPVLIVGVIMFFSYWKQRSLHRTVRMMVEKGQPVPESLFATPSSPIRQRSDMRRGVVLVMVGLGLMVFFGAVNDWEGGAWALGIIPFLIGCGYLLVWQLEGRKMSALKSGTDNPPPLS